LLVGTSSGGIFRTTDHGLYWGRLDEVPDVRRIKSLRQTPNALYALNDSGRCYTKARTEKLWRKVNLPSFCLDIEVFDQKAWFVCEGGIILSDEGHGAEQRGKIQLSDRTVLVALGNRLAVVFDSTVTVFNPDADSVASWRVPVVNWTVSCALGDQLLMGGRSTGLRKINLQTGEVTFVFAGPAEAENISALEIAGDKIVIGTNRGSGRCYVVSETSPKWHALNPAWFQGSFDVTDLVYANDIVYVATRDQGVHAGRIDGITMLPIHDAYEQTIFTGIRPLQKDFIIVSRRAGLLRIKQGSSALDWFTRTLPPSYEYFATTIDNRVVAGLSEGRILWSDDEGATWQKSADSLPGFNELNTVGDVVYASTRGGLYQSTDKGTSWGRVNGPWKSSNIHWTAGVKDTVFVTTTEATYRNLNGSGFTPLVAAFTPGTMTNFTTVRLRNGLLFATGTPAVYVSSDVGDTWQQKSFDGTNAIISQFFYKDHYYILTDRGVIWRSLIP